jgi:hypothetical protein
VLDRRNVMDGAAGTVRVVLCLDPAGGFVRCLVGGLGCEFTGVQKKAKHESRT